MNTKILTKKDEEYLAELKRNLDMTAESTTQVIKKVSSREFLTLLTEVVMKSTELSKELVDYMATVGVEAEEFSKMKQLSADMGIMMNTLFDSSDSHIAEMMVKGLEMGVTEMREFTEKSGQPDDRKVAELIEKVTNFESTYAHKIGKYVERE